jgi:hypothetical protein
MPAKMFPLFYEVFSVFWVHQLSWSKHSDELKFLNFTSYQILMLSLLSIFSSYKISDQLFAGYSK